MVFSSVLIRPVWCEAFLLPKKASDGLASEQIGKNLMRPLDRKKEAETEQTETLEILQPYGFVRVAADEGKAVAPVLKRILSRVSEREYSGLLTPAYVNEVMLAAHSFGSSHEGYMAGAAPKKDKPLKLSKQQTYKSWK